MNKKVLFSLLFLLLFIGSVKLSDALQSRLLFFTNFLKSTYLDISGYFENLIFEHIKQQETIQKLYNENLKLKETHLKYPAYKNELFALKNECNASASFDFETKVVRVLSYAKFGDFMRLWIDFEEFEPEKIYGITKNGYAAGIVVSKNGKPLALLNGDPKCSYAVEIGEVKAPGIATGKNEREMEVKFIPMWKEIKVGDEVITSGLDMIFFHGIKVGKVARIKKSGSYKTALVRTYADILSPRYFTLILSPY
ncbi:rod shape-determining protein MreC [Nitrosophilus alvini]|uniref:rod shape-determining protein MreC n=1 Tax=Nitrosophilus alvini TaxID=2714855 RepID=UPI00190A53C4|nr:rod shape-determining protein MreC [Nitrosophilus alvini]